MFAKLVFRSVKAPYVEKYAVVAEDGRTGFVKFNQCVAPYAKVGDEGVIVQARDRLAFRPNSEPFEVVDTSETLRYPMILYTGE